MSSILFLSRRKTSSFKKIFLLYIILTHGIANATIAALASDTTMVVSFNKFVDKVYTIVRFDCRTNVNKFSVIKNIFLIFL
jgi:hypothetical protein